MRPADNERDAAALDALGIATRIEPYLEIHPVPNPAGAMRLIATLATPHPPSRSPVWLVITSVNALREWEKQLPVGALTRLSARYPTVRFAAVGAESAAELLRRGARQVHQNPGASAGDLAESLLRLQARTLVVPRGALAMAQLAQRLTAAGATVESEILYDTRPVGVPPASAEPARRAGIDVVLLRSPSAAAAVAGIAGARSFSAYCAGPTTAERARGLGFTVCGTSPDASPAVVARGIARLLTPRRVTP